MSMQYLNLAIITSCITLVTSYPIQFSKYTQNFNRIENLQFAYDKASQLNSLRPSTNQNPDADFCPIENCLKCESSLYCLECKEGYNNKGMACITPKNTERMNIDCPINNCQLCDPQKDKCKKCDDAYYLSNSICFKCSANCDFCTSFTNCINCENGYDNKNGKCDSNSTSSETDYKSIGLIIGMVLVSIVVMLLCTWVIIRYKKNKRKGSQEYSGALSNLRVTYLRTMNILETNEQLESNRRDLYQYSSQNAEKNDGVQEIIPITRHNFDTIVKAVVFNDKLKHYGENICTICLENFIKGKKYRITPCGHLFHYECIFSWIIDANKKKCPNDNYRFG